MTVSPRNDARSASTCHDCRPPGNVEEPIVGEKSTYEEDQSNKPSHFKNLAKCKDRQFLLTQNLGDLGGLGDVGDVVLAGECTLACVDVRTRGSHN